MIHSSTLCMNGFRHVHQYQIETLSSNLNLLEWLNGQTLLPKFYWRGQEGEEYAGIGSVFSLNEPPHFDQGNDSPARLWGGHAFDQAKHRNDPLWASFPSCRFFLPQVELVKKEGKVIQIINAINGPINPSVIQEPKAIPEQSALVSERVFTPTKEGWVTLIDELLKEIDEGEYTKVVMARHTIQSTKEPLNPFALLAHLKTARSTLFAFQFEEEALFIGATPEHLYKRKNSALFVDAVAGTRKRGHTAEEDAFFEGELLKSPKEKREFEFVKLSIKEALASICTTCTTTPDPTVLKTPYVQHLFNRFEGALKPYIGDDHILSTLHPTAAIGGYPRQEALNYLIQKEPFNRGWYAAPIGFASEHEAEFVVGIRSALIKSSAIHTFSGAGIVDGSDAQSEWEELEHKESLWNKI